VESEPARKYTDNVRPFRFRRHWMVHRFVLTLFLLSLISGAAFAQTEDPPFVTQLIERFKSAPPGKSPGAVWRYLYKGAPVFYVPRLACCDIPSDLYDVGGNLMCHPDGGIAGSGDGKCLDFFLERSEGERLWSDGTVGESHDDGHS
jgi:hypothetical protein